jgi:hypothetical protein
VEKEVSQARELHLPHSSCSSKVQPERCTYLQSIDLL